MPLLADCGLLSLRLGLAGPTPFGKVTPAKYDEAVARGTDPLRGSGWEEVREAAPQMIARALPSLRYVAVASGYMVEDPVAPGGADFVGETRWWRVMAGDADYVTDRGAPQLVELNASEGSRMDAYMSSEAFADTLELPPLGWDGERAV